MKALSIFTKYILTPACTVGGIYYGIDKWVISRAESVNEPTRVRLEAHLQSGEINRKNIMDSISRIERNQESDRKLLIRIIENTNK